MNRCPLGSVLCEPVAQHTCGLIEDAARKTAKGLNCWGVRRRLEMLLPSAGMKLLGFCCSDRSEGGDTWNRAAGGSDWAPSPGETPRGACGGRPLGIVIQQWRLKMWT